MAAKWLKECETRAKVIEMIVMEQFITILPEEIRVWAGGPQLLKILYKISNLPDFMQDFKISITLFFNYRRRQRIYINISNH